jgi:predicted TIM-barrel fold metal-dependent hydrolase
VLIDTQTHYVPPGALALLRIRAGRGGALPAGLTFPLDDASPMSRLDVRLEAMEAHGIDASVLSFAPIGISDDDHFARDLTQAANDGLVEACKAHPTRFTALASLPLPDVEASLAELTRLDDASEIRGLCIVAQTTLYRPDEIGLETLLRAAVARNAAVVIHPPAGVADLNPAFDAFGLGSGLHAMTGASLVLARLILSGTLDRLPKLDLIATHLGGVLPYLAERLDDRGRGTERPFSVNLKERLWFDACGAGPGPALRLLIERAGAERVMLGSDWPSRPLAQAVATLRDAQLTGAAAQRWFKP